MKPLFERLTPAAGASFVRWFTRKKAFEFKWHYHSEYELTYIVRSRGARYVGDHIGPYEDGDFVLLGSDLPHTWCSDEVGSSTNTAFVIQFSSSLLGPEMARIPEMKYIGRLLQSSSRGIVFPPSTRWRKAMERIVREKGLSSLIGLLCLLEELARCRARKFLASVNYSPKLTRDNETRFADAHRFILQNYCSPLRLEQVARVANLSSSAFSRSFTRMTGKPFQNFVTELRIGHACELLSSGSLTITEIAYASGFENLSNFNRRFRDLKGMTPTEFRVHFR